MTFKQKFTTFLLNNGLIEKTFDGAQSVVSRGFNLWSSSKKMDPEKVMNQYKGWVYVAARAIAEDAATIPIRTFEVKNGEVVENLDNDILDILGAMNHFQTGYEVKYSLVVNLIMAGNAYWLLEGVTDENSEPTSIHPIPTKNIKVIRGGKGEAPIKGYEIKRAGEKEFKQPWEIMHFRLPDPNDPIEGIGVVQAIAQWIDLDNSQTDMNSAFFRNGARIGGFLESDSAITAEQLDFLTKSFEQAYSGTDQAYKVAALPKGTTFKEGQVGPKDIDYAQGSKDAMNRILAGFRVPKTILGAAESDTNRSTAETAEFIFAKRTIKPLMELIVTQLNEFFVPRFSDTLFLVPNDTTPVDRVQLNEEIKTAMAGQAFMSFDEAREKQFGLGPVSNGNLIYGNVITHQPISTVEKKEIGNFVAEKNIKAPITRAAKSAKKRKSMAEGIVEAAIKEAEEQEKALKVARSKALENITQMSDDDFEAICKAFISRVTPFEKRMKDQIKEYNAKQEKEVIKNVKKLLEKAIKNDDLFNKDEWTNLLVELVGPNAIQLYEQEHQAASELIGFDDITGLTPEAKKGLEKGLALMARKYNQTTLNLLKEKLEAGLREGQGFEQLKREIKKIYEFSNDVRAAQVARSETFRAANYATKQAWKEIEVVKTIKWYTAADERVCPWCEPMNGKIVSIESDFFKKGDEHIGSNGKPLILNYADIGNPPLHVSCRCYIRPESIQIKSKEEKPKKKVEKKKESPKKDKKKEAEFEKLDKVLDKILKDD